MFILTTFSTDLPGVRQLPADASLRQLAAAALQMRKEQPRATLVVAAPERLVRELERRYPPLLDVALTSVEALGEFQGKNSLSGAAAEE